jgi:hypothetical protein
MTGLFQMTVLEGYRVKKMSFRDYLIVQDSLKDILCGVGEKRRAFSPPLFTCTIHVVIISKNR